MRSLLYYPMIHIPSSSFLELVVNDIENKGNKDVMDEIKKTIPDSMEKINEYWYDFLDYLKSQEKFDRIYFDSWIYDNMVPRIAEDHGGGMKDCLDFLIDSGAKFEKTESEYILVYGDKFNEIVYNLSRKLQPVSNIIPIYTFTTALQSRAREIYTTRRIGKTLKVDERGLLLYGLRHANRLFLSSLRSLDLDLEVFDHIKKSAVKA